MHTHTCAHTHTHSHTHDKHPHSLTHSPIGAPKAAATPAAAPQATKSLKEKEQIGTISAENTTAGAHIHAYACPSINAAVNKQL